jgi:hypothetical protein
MRLLALWREAPVVSRIVAALGLGLATFILAISQVPIYKAQSRAPIYFVVPVILIGLSVWLLWLGRRVFHPQPPKAREANEAVMPVPSDPPKAAISRSST